MITFIVGLAGGLLIGILIMSLIIAGKKEGDLRDSIYNEVS